MDNIFQPSSLKIRLININDCISPQPPVITQHLWNPFTHLDAKVWILGSFSKIWMPHSFSSFENCSQVPTWRAFKLQKHCLFFSLNSIFYFWCCPSFFEHLNCPGLCLPYLSVRNYDILQICVLGHTYALFLKTLIMPKHWNIRGLVTSSSIWTERTFLSPWESHRHNTNVCLILSH